MNRQSFILLTIFALLTAACHKDDDPDDAPDSETETTAPQSSADIMVVFAPGQLGDLGYADNIMGSISTLKNQYSSDSDTVNIRCMSPWDMADMRESFKQWARNTQNIFTDGDYNRRLLVLTEQFMESALDAIKDDLKKTDAVLMLKAAEDDIDKYAKKYGLEGRLYGLNISASYSIRRYVPYIKYLAKTFYDFEGKIVKTNKITLLRLYDEELYPCRDSIMETIAEVAPEIEIDKSNMGFDEDVYGVEELSIIKQAAYIMAVNSQIEYEEGESPFVIFDYGVANSGADYWLLSREYDGSTFFPMIFDGKDNIQAGRTYMMRDFGTALTDWCERWLQNDTDIPKHTHLTGSKYCKDDFNQW